LLTAGIFFFPQGCHSNIEPIDEGDEVGEENYDAEREKQPILVKTTRHD